VKSNPEWTLEELEAREEFRKKIKEEIKNVFKYREFRFGKRSLKNFISPCVYIYLSSNEALYIGMSKVGLQRALTPKRGNILTDQLFEEADELIIYPVDTEIEAKKAEKLLIQELLPRYNRK